MGMIDNLYLDLNIVQSNNLIFEGLFFNKLHNYSYNDLMDKHNF